MYFICYCYQLYFEETIGEHRFIFGNDIKTGKSTFINANLSVVQLLYLGTADSLNHICILESNILTYLHVGYITAKQKNIIKFKK